jgi:hypothetical protein
VTDPGLIGPACVTRRLTEQLEPLLGSMSTDQRCVVLRRDAPATERERVNFRPSPHDGVRLGDCTRSQRELVMRLLAVALSPETFLRVCSIMSMEDVIAQQSGWRKDQQACDYWFAVDLWGMGFRKVLFEGHHISVSVVWNETDVSVSPIFLGAYPARVAMQGIDLFRPLALEAELGRDIVQRDHESVMEVPTPPDLLRSGVSEFPESTAGVAFGDLSFASRQSVIKLLNCYLSRAAAGANHTLVRSLHASQLRFQWRGALDPREDHYYLLHDGRNICIEYINQRHAEFEANHEHTLMRSPSHDFGAGIA